MKLLLAVDGKIVKCHSYVLQWLELIHVQLAQLTDFSITDVGSTARDVDANSINLKGDAASGDDSYGIQVGSGSGAEDPSDVALGTKITHGTGAGQLQYQAMSITAPAIDGDYVEYELARDFINSSGGAVTVNEVGMVLQGHDGTAARYFLVLRDVLPDPPSIDDGETLPVKYTLRTKI